MPANFVLLEKITVGAAGASSVTFSGIPQTGYTDLVVKATARCTGSTSSFAITFNGSSANLSGIYLTGTGSSAVSGSFNPFGRANYNSTTANTFSNNDIYIPNYASSNFKSFSIDGVQEDNTTTAYSSLEAGLWSNTAAITSITLAPASDTFVANSTFYLYGVAKLGTTPAIVPYATGGDTIMTDGTYWYHAFTSSGTFTPAKGLSCDVLVVAGGGGGASGGSGGGGGAGGLQLLSAQSLSTTNYSVTVGAGGASDTQGNNSQLGALTASVGGGKGGSGVPGGNGGSGGGAYPGEVGGTATSGQGNNGGAGGTFTSPYSSGGGGGAGAVGTAGNSAASQSGAGGAGTNTYSAWLSVTGLGVSGYIAGGGGGGANTQYGGTSGAGGSGGGGAGGNPGVAGTANTGGGGGGSATQPGGAGTGGIGGSGLVVVRYAV